MINIYTIGVYNSTEDSFFEKILKNNIDLFCDIRQRRGVRGSQYKYVNCKYLQDELKKLGVDYRYIKELAPTNEIRQKQKDADKIAGETKKQRTTLGEVFSFEYRKQILGAYNMNELANELNESNYKNIVFFCVEEYASACHRSLVADKLGKLLDVNVVNL